MVQIAINRNFQNYRRFDGRRHLRKTVSFGKLDPAVLERSRYLTLVNQILVDQRKFVWDHEHHLHGGDGVAWHGAALVMTQARRIFVASNAHLQNSLATRNCAEANVTTEAFNYEGPFLQTGELILSGGRADFSKNIAMLPGEEGRRYAPCGSCRDVIYNWRLREYGRETLVTLLPLNNGTWTILPYDGRAVEDLDHNQAYTTTINKLLPDLEVSIPDNDGRLKKTVQNAWRYIQQTDGKPPLTQLLEATRLEILGRLPPPRQIIEINSLILDKLQQLYISSDRHISLGRVSIVRSHTGEFYMGASSINGRTTNMHPAPDQAIGRALGHNTMARATDAFVATFDFENIENVCAQWNRNPRAPVLMPTLDGDGRERIKKLANIQDGMKDILGRPLKKHDASIHVLPAMVTDEFNPDVMITRSLSHYLPYGYINPRIKDL